MPLINVLVNGRNYTLACDEGEEQRVQELGEYLDKHVRELKGTVTNRGDARLLLMAGLVIADELNEALLRVEQRDREIGALKARLGEPEDAQAEAEDRLAEILEITALRIEAIAAKLARA